MFEVGKKYKKKNIEGVYVLDCPQNGSEYGWFKGEATGKLILLMYSCFDPIPIDDAPAPRMVTTCDIGARVVRGRDWEWWNQDGGAGNKGTIIELGDVAQGCCAVKWDNSSQKFAYKIGAYGKYDLYYADEQPKKEAESVKIRAFELANEQVKQSEIKCNPDKAKTDDEGNDKTPPDPAPVITQKNKSDPTPQAMIMIGSKPRLMYGSLLQIQGPTKDEEARNARTEEERKRYER